MSHKEQLRPLSLSIGASLLPSFSLVSASSGECHGKICHPIEEYCSAFKEECVPCSQVCDTKSHNYEATTCVKECAAYNSYIPLKAEINSIQRTLHVVLLLLCLLLALIAVRYMIKSLGWLRRRRCLHNWLSRGLSKQSQASNGKDLNATTITNLSAINRDIERAPSQIYSVTGAAEGSVMTLATPVSTRYPAENSTTPTTVVTEVGYNNYNGGYDNQAMAITPVAEKPSGHIMQES